MRWASFSSSVSRRSPPNVTTAAAVTSPMMNTTTISSMSVKPRGRARRARMELLSEIPVANVGIRTFTAFLAVGSERIEVILLAARSREHVLIRQAPRIVADALDVAAVAPVAHGRVVRSLRQRGQSQVGARIL